MAADSSDAERWPALPLAWWADTYSTLHMWTQVVGKVRLALAPPVNHWWHVTLAVTARGLTTRAMPYAGGSFEIAFEFIGKSSPAHFFWGSFDHAVTRFSGRRAPEREGADPITREAYSHEVISVGFWPGSAGVSDAAFYAYAAPEPPGFKTAPVGPRA